MSVGVQRRENFTVDSFRRLEMWVQQIRRAAMNCAATQADHAEKDNREEYQVDPEHVDSAIERLLSGSEAAEVIGIPATLKKKK